MGKYDWQLLFEATRSGCTFFGDAWSGQIAVTEIGKKPDDADLQLVVKNMAAYIQRNSGHADVHVRAVKTNLLTTALVHIDDLATFTDKVGLDIEIDQCVKGETRARIEQLIEEVHKFSVARRRGKIEIDRRQVMLARAHLRVVEIDGCIEALAYELGEAHGFLSEQTKSHLEEMEKSVKYLKSLFPELTTLGLNQA